MSLAPTADLEILTLQDDSIEDKKEFDFVLESLERNAMTMLILAALELICAKTLENELTLESIQDLSIHVRFNTDHTPGTDSAPSKTSQYYEAVLNINVIELFSQI